MAAGCPIVATDVGGNHTAVIHGENGSLVTPADSRALASEIVKLLQDEQMRKRYVSKGLDLLRTKFSSQIMTAQYESLYMMGRR
jgi:glycosyltransferase involved in cell wall biosynthesis